jgi:hypothetical protein
VPRTTTAVTKDEDERNDALDTGDSGNHAGPERSGARERKIHRTCSDGTTARPRDPKNEIV